MSDRAPLSCAILAVATAGVACSAPETRTGDPKPCAAESPAFHVQRIHEVTETFEVVPRLGTPSPSEAARGACEHVDEIVRPICFEGAAAAYGAAVVDGLHSGTDERVAIAEFEQRMRLADDRWARIHCRGFGDGLPDLDVTRLDEVRASLSERCGKHALDGWGAGVAWHTTTDLDSCRFSDTPECTAKIERFFSRFDVDALCAHHATLETEWCAFGVGRMLGNFFAGRFELAARSCRGRSRAACLGGVGHVSVYLYPDRIDRALKVAVQLAPADQAAFFEGIANALQWRRGADAAKLDGWIAQLSPSARKLATELLAAATSCGLVDFHDGVNCRWPVVRRGCDL